MSRLKITFVGFISSLLLLTSFAAFSEKLIVIDPNRHTFSAYHNGRLVHSGMATAGAGYCRDTGRRCRTPAGTFRIFSLGGPGCRSSRYPVGRGGAPMPYCMFFARNMAIHGSPASHVVPGNISHGCVRVHVGDAKWLRYNFVEGPNKSNGYRGTRVVIRPY